MLPRNEYRISITPYCNMKCIYCHNEGNTKENNLSIESIEKLIIDSKNWNLESIRLTGGEPLIHPDIFEICKMISEKYGLKVGINTNGIEIDKLLELVRLGFIDRVVIGMDYFNSSVSKKSPIGKSSDQIKQNIKRLKKAGCDVSIASVYFNDDNNKIDMIEWGIRNRIRIKIIEEVLSRKDDETTKSFIKFRKMIIDKYKSEVVVDEFNEINMYIDAFKAVTFFHSHCAANECDVCKKIHIRITADGSVAGCIFKNNKYINIKDINFKTKMLQYLKG